MKKSANTSVYGNYNQESNPNFLAVSNLIIERKIDFMALCAQTWSLSQEKLPIIYANIRV
jgi:hypothetical protein